MIQNLHIIAAPSILGLKPTGVENLAASLLSHGLNEKLNATNPVVHLETYNQMYSAQRSRPDAILNEEKLVEFSHAVFQTSFAQFEAGKFPLILGGDCSIIIGAMAALKSQGNYGLIFMDAHADFYLPHESITGEAADMDLALVTGRGPDSLTNIHDLKPYVQQQHVFHIGQRDGEEVKKYHSQNIQDTAINCFDYKLFEKEKIENISDKIIREANVLKLDGYWIHFDTDVISDDENPAVDYRLPGGLTFYQCESLLTSFLKYVKIAGMTVTIFNPQLDSTGTISKRITACISKAFSGI
jgi:arginase